MTQVTAKLNDYRQSPRKVRVVANLVRGKKASVALNNLAFLSKDASAPIKKLIQSALSNAKNLNIEVEDLIVSEIRVDGGAILYRRLPASRGRAHPLRKRTSHISVVLDTISTRTKSTNKKKAEDSKPEVKNIKAKNKKTVAK